MKLRKWDDLPPCMKNDEVKVYYDLLLDKQNSILLKRFLDFILAVVIFFILLVPGLIIAILIKLDSNGPVFYRQERVTSYGRHFFIHKFRTMVVDADKVGTLVTIKGDNRITRMGILLRKYRIDEFPQIIDVLNGNMSFVGTRPEAVKYVNHYTKEMYATLLLPAGITSGTSIRYKDEAQLLEGTENADETYINVILPEKMKMNLEDLQNYSLWNDIKIFLLTGIAIFRKG